MESISIIKGATYLKKEATKVQRQKSFFFAQIPHAFIQCTVTMKYEFYQNLGPLRSILKALEWSGGRICPM